MELKMFDRTGATIQCKNKVGLTLQETLSEKLENNAHNYTIADLSALKNKL